MNRNSRYSLGAAVAVLLVAAGVWLFIPRPPAPTPPSPHLRGAESLLIETANIIAPFDEEEVPDLLDQFRRACHASCEELPGDARLSRGLATSFTREATERLGLYILPSYDRYRAYAKRLTGRDPEDAGPGNVITSVQDFQASTAALRLLPFDPEAVHVRALFLGGRSAQAALTARCSYSPDNGHFYTDIGHFPEKAGATIYEVLVPVDAPDAFNPKVRVRLVLGMAFALDKGVWKPWRMGVHDPSGVDRILAPPWL